VALFRTDGVVGVVAVGVGFEGRLGVTVDLVPDTEVAHSVKVSHGVEVWAASARYIVRSQEKNSFS